MMQDNRTDLNSWTSSFNVRTTYGILQTVPIGSYKNLQTSLRGHMAFEVLVKVVQAK